MPRNEIRSFVDGVTSVPDNVMKTVGGATGVGTGLVEVADEATQLPFIYPDFMVYVFDFGLVFFYGMIGALGAAFVNWILKRFIVK